jgi:hypothetical protein
MAWSNSKIFRSCIADMIGNVAAFDWDADTIKIALYNNTTTPDNDVTAANSAYNVGQWVVANEVSDAAEWAAGGVALTGKTVDVSVADTVKVDAADTASGTSATLANVYGGLVYDDTLAAPVAKQGICYLYFGGVQSVTDGTLTVIYSANGIMSFTL